MAEQYVTADQLIDWLEAYATASGIAMAQAVQLVAPDKTSAFAAALAALAPRVAAVDHVSGRMLLSIEGGARLFNRNEGVSAPVPKRGNRPGQ